MNAVTIISGSIVIAAAVSIFAILPRTVTINVGDAGSRVDEIGRYGYGKSIFSLAPKRDADGNRLEPSAFLIGPDGYHLLIWHNDKINSMTHFRHEQTVPNTYGEWHDIKSVNSFTLDRPSPFPFFVGIAILCIAGYFLQRFRRTSIALYTVLTMFVLLMIAGFSTLAGTFAILPMLVGLGWLAAPILGRSLRNNQQTTAEVA
ncbi:MAG: hypothetical protein ABL888_10120 [Pirellulaceae bacterium]